MSVLNKLASKFKEPPPVWAGPVKDGITYSLLVKFMTCRERFRVRVIEGLTPMDTFNHRLEYGNMWHLCEETWSQGLDWVESLRQYGKKLSEKYPVSRTDILHWYTICKMQFEEYILYWEKHPDMQDKRTLLPETSFGVEYPLPDGRKVLLRGKWDLVDIVDESEIWLQENKTKSEVDETSVGTQLSYDAQTMLYLSALQVAKEQLFTEGVEKDAPIVGVRYNAIKRPLSGGRGTIRQKKGETSESFYDRLRDDYLRTEPEYYFHRWNARILEESVDLFRQQCLDPLLMQVSDWWESMERNNFKNPWATGKSVSWHWRHPYGIYNVVNETGSSDIDEYLRTGSMAGLHRNEELFPELNT